MGIKEINNKSFTFQKDVKPHQKYHIKKVKDKDIWENFLLECEEKTFLSSWNWGEFQKKEGNKIWRLGVYDEEELAGVVLVVKVEARRGTFLFVPHGPNIKSKINPPLFQKREGQKSKILELLLDKLKLLAKEEKASFIRMASVWEKNEENIKIFKDLGFRKAPIHMHAETTWNLNLAPGEEELLMGMRKTTRYLIRQAEKNKGIEISQSRDIKDLELFNKIYQETTKRHHFVPFSLNYLKNQFLSFSSDNQILIFLGKYKGEIVSSAIIIYWQGIGFYHHGASLVKYNKIPVSYLLQWEAIKEAKRRGCKLYNFWGIAPEDKKHPWSGLTVFKTGFGGYKREYIKTQDLPLKPIYWLTYFFEKLRKTKRGL